MNIMEAEGLIVKIAGRYPNWKSSKGQNAAWADELAGISVQSANRAITRLGDNGFERTMPTAMQFRRLCLGSGDNTPRSTGCSEQGCSLRVAVRGLCDYHAESPIEHLNLVTRRIDHYRSDLDYLDWLQQTCAVEILNPELYNNTQQRIFDIRADYPIGQSESPLVYRARVGVMVRNKILDQIAAPLELPVKQPPPAHRKGRTKTIEQLTGSIGAEI